MKNIKFVSKLMFIVTFLIGGFFLNPSNTIAANGTLIAKDFITWNQAKIKGYDAGFTLSGRVFNDASSIVIKLYSGETLLQTNTAVPGKISGTEFLTPFDVNGTFDYTKDGYFTNKRESEYGKNSKPTKVIATVIFNDGQILTATNSSLDVKQFGAVLGANTFKFSQKMKNGSRGNEVIELQKFLNAKGYNCGNADGIFGKMTDGALKQYQTANKLDADGIVGPMTRSYLNK
jgi:hypothetical protein